MIDEEELDPTDELEDAVEEETEEVEDPGDEQPEEEQPEEPEQPDWRTMPLDELAKARPDLAEALAKPEPVQETPQEDPETKYAADYEAIAFEVDPVKAEKLRRDLYKKIDADEQMAAQARYLQENRPVFEEEILKEVAGDDQAVRDGIKGYLKKYPAHVIAAIKQNPQEKEMLALMADGLKHRAAKPRTTTASRPATNGATRPPTVSSEEKEIVDYLVKELKMSPEAARAQARKEMAN